VSANLVSWRQMKLRVALLVCLIACLLTGCGGGGTGSHTVTLVQGSFSIEWPTRSREIANPLTSSLSAVVVFPKAGSGGTDVSLTVNRDTTNVSAHSDTYTIPQKVVTSAVRSLTATFYSDYSAQGSVVGTATAVASINGSTVQFSHIVFSGTIKHVSAIPTTLQTGGSATQLAFSATDVSGNVVAVTPGSAIWTVVSGKSALTLTPDGIATPLQMGQAQVAATIDGIVSAPATITISPGSLSNATFQISWPARSGPTLGHPLSSALSVLVTFKGGKVGGSDLPVAVDRDPTQLGAFTRAYTIDQPIELTCKSMTATFYSLAGEQGVVVGTATAEVTVGQSSVNLASVVVSGVIASVKVVPTSNIVVGASGVQLQFSAMDSTGAAVAVTPGSSIWAVASGQANLTLTAAGVATGTHVGQATVTASVDGFTSQPTTLQVVSATETSYGNGAIRRRKRGDIVRLNDHIEVVEDGPRQQVNVVRTDRRSNVSIPSVVA